MRKFLQNKEANVKEIGMVVGLLVTIAIAILVFFNIAASLDTNAIDTNLAGSPARNATNATLDQAATFFTIAPIIAIVVVAVIILGYVTAIGGTRGE